ncbi:unnamed protein product [Ectocarpus fasciculatus]
MIGARSASIMAVVIAMAAACALATTNEGKAYLQRNSKAANVVTLASGLQYKVLESGPSGGLTPSPKSPCVCHYRGYLMDGTEFDSSYKRNEPMTFAPYQVIRGWKEAMQLMKEGDKWQLFIPSELAYGDRQTGPHITPGSVLLFDIEIIKVVSDGFVK